MDDIGKTPVEPDSSSVPAPTRTEHLTQESSEQGSRSHKTIRYLLVALVVVILAAGSYAAYSFYQQAHAVAKKSADQVAQIAHPAPPTTSATLGGLQAKYVTLPLTADQAKVDPIIGDGGTFTSANGHYLLRDPRGFKYTDSDNLGGNLLYDGRSIYNGPYLWQFGLSQNGEHYIYELDTSASHTMGNAELYVDGKLVQTIPVSHGVYYPQVSDDGRDYAYTTGKDLSSGDPYVVKDGRVIYTSTSSIGTLEFDENLNHYIVSAQPLGGSQRPAQVYDVAMDGKSLLTSADAANNPDQQVALSPNGQHYLYVAGGTLYLDGRQILQHGNAQAITVTDSGDYALIDPQTNSIITSKKTYAVTSQYSEGCDSYCPSSFSAFSNDGLHFIFHTDTQVLNSWNLDGSSINPTGQVEGVEFIGDTLYLYRWAQPYLDIKELGVKFQLNDSVSDAVYAPFQVASTDGSQAFGISTQSLINQQTSGYCSAASGAIGMIIATTNPTIITGPHSTQSLVPDNKTVFKFGSTYIRYVSPQNLGCAVGSVNATTVESDISALESSFSTLQKDN